MTLFSIFKTICVLPGCRRMVLYWRAISAQDVVSIGIFKETSISIQLPQANEQQIKKKILIFYQSWKRIEPKTKVRGDQTKYLFKQLSYINIHCVQQIFYQRKLLLREILYFDIYLKL